MTTNTVYGACPIKRRRRSNAAIEESYARLLDIVEDAGTATVRQIFYLATVAGVVPKTEQGYKAVGRDLLALRRAGRLAYSLIADATRWMRKPRTYDDVEDALSHVARTYRKSLWSDAPVYLELWCEKDTLAGVLTEVTSVYDVPLMVCRGFPSESYLFSSARNILDTGKPTFIYYVGDHDPSGVLIDRHVESRLRAFAPDADITFERLAVRREQIAGLRLQTRPTKRGKNTHAKTFTDAVSVEAEAVEPARLRLIVREAIERHIDAEELRALRVAEASERDILSRLALSMGK